MCVYVCGRSNLHEEEKEEEKKQTKSMIYFKNSFEFQDFDENMSGETYRARS